MILALHFRYRDLGDVSSHVAKGDLIRIATRHETDVGAPIRRQNQRRLEALRNGCVGTNNRFSDLSRLHNRSDLPHEGPDRRLSAVQGVTGDAPLLRE